MNTFIIIEILLIHYYFELIYCAQIGVYNLLKNFSRYLYKYKFVFLIMYVDRSGIW